METNNPKGEESMEERLKKYLKGWTLVDQNNYKKRIPISFLEDFIRSEKELSRKEGMVSVLDLTHKLFMKSGSIQDLDLIEKIQKVILSAILEYNK